MSASPPRPAWSIFKRDDVDAAIRYGRGQWPGVRADWLMADQLFPVCSPALLTGPRPLRCPEDLANHVLLHTSAGAMTTIGGCG